MSPAGRSAYSGLSPPPPPLECNNATRTSSDERRLPSSVLVPLASKGGPEQPAVADLPLNWRTPVKQRGVGAAHRKKSAARPGPPTVRPSSPRKQPHSQSAKRLRMHAPTAKSSLAQRAQRKWCEACTRARTRSVGHCDVVRRAILEAVVVLVVRLRGGSSPRLLCLHRLLRVGLEGCLALLGRHGVRETVKQDDRDANRPR